MSRKSPAISSVPSPTALDVAEAEHGLNSLSPALSGLLDEVEHFLQDGNPKRALEVITRARLNSPWLTNAAAVCQLRQGNYPAAMTSFRSLVIGKGGIMLRDDVPIVFKTNFALSLFLVDNLDGATTLLNELRKEQHPAVAQLRMAFQHWKQNLSAWDRLKWKVGGIQPARIMFDFPLGVLR